MTKIKVFIDFEAISYPFSRTLKVEKDLPFAYSIGIHKGKKFKTKTTIINFQKINSDQVYDFIRKDITENMRKLLNDKSFSTNANSVVFVGWSPILEIKILQKSFKGISVIDLAKGEYISLSKLTDQEFEDNYFVNLKSSVKNNLDNDFIIKRGLNLNGVLAALGGYKLYLDSKNNIKDRFNLSIDTKTLLKEIKEYSKDDVVRMSFLYNNSNIFEERKQALFLINKKKSKINKRINELNNLVKYLDGFDVSMTISNLLKNVDREKEKLKKDKDNLSK